MAAKKPVNVRALILALEVGGKVAFPLQRSEYIYSLKTKLQNTTGNRYTSTTDSKKKTITVERTI